MSRELNEIFSDEEEPDAPGELDDDERDPYGGGSRRADEFDDFIENDSSDDEDRRMGSGDELITRRRAGGRPVDSGNLGLKAGAMGDMDDIFGLAEYEDALVVEADTAEMEERTQDLQLKDVFEPSELQERLLTDEDNAIRWKDVPERFQLARAPFDGLAIGPEELYEEGSWITSTLLSSRRLDRHLEAPFTEAVRNVLRFFVVDDYEVPFVYHQRRDYLIHAVKIPRPPSYQDGDLQYDLQSEKLLFEKDLWAILELDLKFRAFLERRNAFKRLYQALLARLAIAEDPTVEERLGKSTMIDHIQDLLDYLHFHYHTQIRDLAASASAGPGPSHRRPGGRKTIFERIRQAKPYGLVKAFGINADQFAKNVDLGKKREFADDPVRLPHDLADDFTDYPDFPTGEQALAAAKMMLAEEIFTNPRMRHTLRLQWFTQSVIHINVTEKGVKDIDEYHQYYEFKYLRGQVLSAIARNPARYLKMLKAENDGLVEIVYELQDSGRLMRDLYDFIVSDNYSEVADAWNKERRDVVDAAMLKFSALFTKSLRDELRSACENEIANLVNQIYSKVGWPPFPSFLFLSFPFPAPLPRVLNLIPC